MTNNSKKNNRKPFLKTKKKKVKDTMKVYGQYEIYVYMNRNSGDEDVCAKFYNPSKRNEHKSIFASV